MALGEVALGYGDTKVKRRFLDVAVEFWAFWWVSESVDGGLVALVERR